jgi:hypothetical protein
MATNALHSVLNDAGRYSSETSGTNSLLIALIAREKFPAHFISCGFICIDDCSCFHGINFEVVPHEVEIEMFAQRFTNTALNYDSYSCYYIRHLSCSRVAEYLFELKVLR